MSLRPFALSLLAVLAACTRRTEAPPPWHADPVLVDRVVRAALEAGHRGEAGLGAYTVSLWEAGSDRCLVVVRERPDGTALTSLLRYDGTGLMASPEAFEGEAGSSRARIGGREFHRIYTATGFKETRNPLVPLP